VRPPHFPDDNREREWQRFLFSELLPRLRARHPELSDEEIVRLAEEDAPAVREALAELKQEGDDDRRA